MIIKRITFATTLVLTLAFQAATIQPIAASETRFQKVASETELLATLVGKTLTSRDYTFRLNADNTLEGSYQGRSISGRWVYVSNDAICFDMTTSMHCVTPSVNSGDITSVRFGRSTKVHNRLYLSNPYPNLMTQYSVSQ